MRRCGWIAVALLLVVTVLIATPLLLTTRLANLALGRFLPDNRAQIGSASLSLGGGLILREVVINDSGLRASKPLATAREIDAGFGWRELFARRLGWIRANQVTLYARSDGHSQLSLIDLAYQLWRPSTGSPASPFSIGTIEVHGRIREEGLIPFSATKSDLPMALQMTMTGARAAPSRHLTVAIGNLPQGEQESAKSGASAHPLAAPGDLPFVVTADLETQSWAEGTRVVIHRLAAAHAALTLDAATLRNIGAALPREMHGKIEAGLDNLSASGAVDLGHLAKRDHFAGSVVFSGLRMRVAGDPKTTLNLHDLSGAASFEHNRQPMSGTSITLDRLNAKSAKASVEADTLRQLLPALPPELRGRIETGLADLSASGAANLAVPAKRDHFAGSVVFSGLRIRVAGDPKMTLNLDDLSGAAGIASNLPPMADAVITVKRLHASRADASIDMEAWRRYAPKLPPAFSHGSIATAFGAFDVVGVIKSGKRNALGFSGSLALHDFGVHSSAAGQPQCGLDRLTTQANVDVRLDRWEPAALRVRSAITRWAEFSYGGKAVNNLEAVWHADGALLTFDRIAAQIFGGEVSGAPRIDLAARTFQDFDVLIKSVDAHQALANVSPAHLDADGVASGTLHLASNTDGELSGHADLSFDGPGVLRIGQIEELQRMLAGNFGAEMANLAMHDLEHYPFKQGSLHLESAGVNSEMKIHFVRQLRTAADRINAPRKEIINGREVWVGSLVVPKIDLTIPIAGKSYAEILSMVSGFHPLIESVGKQSGK